MKKSFTLAVATLGILTFGSLTSCQDEDFGASTEVLKQRSFEHSFTQEFGQPLADQSWDFYTQKLQSLRVNKVQ